MKVELGVFATLGVSLCCLGVPVVVAPLTAIGLGFLLKDLILLPLVFLFLLITLWGLHTGSKRYGDRRPFLLGMLVSVLLIPSFFLSPYFALFLLLLLFIAAICNTVAAYRATHSPT